MGVSLACRFVAYAPAGNRIGVVPFPISATATDVFNDIGAGTIDYLAGAQHSSMLEDLCEIAVEMNDGSGDGQTWVEPMARMMRLKRGGSTIDETNTRRYTLHSYGMQLAKMRMLREEELNDEGDRIISGVTVGGLVKLLFDEAKTRGAVTAFTYDFTATADSSGAAWGGNIPPQTLRYGDDLLTLLRALADNGACDWRIVGRTLKLYRPDRLGSDRSATVRLFNGQDLLEAPDDEDATELAGRIGVIGDDGRTYEAISPTMSEWGLWEETVNASGVKDIGGLQFIGEAEQRRRSAPRVQMTRKLNAVDVRFLPFFRYGVGDQISAPNDKGEHAPLRVRELQLSVGADGIGVNATLNDRILERDLRDRRTVAGMLGGASSSSGGSGVPTKSDDKRKPNAPTGLVVGTAHAFDAVGAPFAIIDAQWAPTTTGSDGKPIAVTAYQLYGRANVTGEPWRQISASDDGATRIVYSPLPAGEEWQFKVRAVSSTGIVGPFSAAVLRVLASDESPPLKPSKPTATSRLGQILIGWDGRDYLGGAQPSDYSHTDVYMATSATGGGSICDSIRPGEPSVITDQPYNETRWFFLVSVDSSGNNSEPSARVSVATKPLVDTDVIDRVIDGANIKLDSIGTDLLAEPVKATLTAANGKNNVFYASSAPTSTTARPLVAGDTWFDTSDGNRIRRWTGSAWSAAQFGTNAIANAAITNAQILDATIDSAKIANLDAGKINAGTLDAARIGAQTITADKLIIGDITNYLPGGGFDTDADLAAWDVVGDGYIARGNGNAIGSAGGLFVAGTAGTPKNWRKFIQVQEGQEWLIQWHDQTTATYNGTASNGKLRLGDQNDGILVAWAWGEAHSFRQNTKYYKVPAGVTGIWVTLMFDHTVGTVKLDNLQMRIRNAGDLLVDGAVTARTIATNAVTADAIAANSVAAGALQANSVTADKISAGAVTTLKLDAEAVTADKIKAKTISVDKIMMGNFSNLIADPKFSLPMGNSWAMTSGSGAIFTTVTQGWSLRLSGATTGLDVRNSAKFDVNPGEQYEMNAMIYNGTDGMAQFVIRWYTQDNAYHSTASIQVASSVSGWNAYTKVVNVPANVDLAYGVVGFTVTSTATSGYAYLTNPRVMKAVSAELIVDGAVTADKIEANAINGKVITGATVRTAASGARTEMNSSGVQVVDASNSPLVRLGYGSSTGMMLADPADGTMIPLAPHVFGTTTGKADGAWTLNKPSSTSVNASPVWSTWKDSDFSTTFRTATGRVVVFAWGEMADIDTRYNYAVQMRLQIIRSSTSAVVATVAEEELSWTQGTLNGFATGLPKNVDLQIRYSGRTMMYSNVGTPAIYKRGWVVMPI